MSKIKSKQEADRPIDATCASASGVVVGVIVGLADDSVPRVSFLGCNSEKGLRARTTAPVAASDIGSQVAILFEGGDTTKPMIIGKIQLPLVQARQNPSSPLDLEIDGERVSLSAKSEIVLRCGKASITLTKAGKIIIRGAYVSNMSSGVNKLKGASVHIN